MGKRGVGLLGKEGDRIKRRLVTILREGQTRVEGKQQAAEELLFGAGQREGCN